MTIYRIGLFSLAVLLTAMFCTACGGSSSSTNSPVNEATPLPQAQVQLEQIRNTSGDPIGIQIVWASVSDETVTGYHLYKSATAIADNARGDDGYWLPVTLNAASGEYDYNAAGETLIPQPVTPGMIVVNDVFPVTIGEQYYYRLTSVDGDDDESHLSGEMGITIMQFQVSTLETTEARVGDQVVITGERFGQYESTTDFVYFPGVEWDDVTGFTQADIPAVIDDWSVDQITVLVPDGATSGPIVVEINDSQQPTPDPFTNLDPYITELTPLTGTVQTSVTVSGANFGSALDTTHFIELDGTGITITGNYTSYSETEIVFFPEYNGTFASLSLAVSADGRTSNTGRFNLTNAAPTVVITASLTEALAPANITFSSVGSFDPESPLDELVFDYDWEGDGTYDALNVGSSSRGHAYTTPGIYQPTLRITDPQGASNENSVSLVIVDAAAVQDNGSPVAGNFYQPDGQLTIQYRLAGGLAPYTLQWYIRDSAGIIPDTQLAEESVTAAGDYSHVFTIDSSIAVPVADSDTLPHGIWQLVCRLSDSATANDPDTSNVWPSAADFYTIYRYRAAVVNDLEGDSTGIAAQAIQTMLTDKGYDLPPTPLISDTVDIAALTAQSVVVWAADGPHGAIVPFDWLSSVDTTLMRAYLDIGGHMVVLGPAGIDAATVFPDDAVFDANYQPYDGVNIAFATPTVTFFARDFLGSQSTAITSFQYANDYSISTAPGLLPGAVRLLDEDAAPGPTTSSIAAIRPSPNPGGGNLFFGQFTFANIASYTPSSVAAADLMDNIAAGTITYVP